MIDKMKIEKVRVNLKADKIRLFDEKNSLVVKKEEFRTETIILNVVGPFNVLVCGY